MKKIKLLSCLLVFSVFAMAQPGKEKGKGKKDDVRTEVKTTPSGKNVQIPAAAAQGKNAKGMEMKEKNEVRREERKMEKDMDGVGGREKDKNLKKEGDKDDREVNPAKAGKDKKGDEKIKDKREKVLTPDQK